MNLRKLLNLAAAMAAVAAAAVVCVIAASFAVYAGAKAFVGPAWAAAMVAALFALTAVTVAWLATRKVPPSPAREAEDLPLAERLIKLAQEKPLIALGAAAAAAVVLIRNPAIVTAVVSAFMAGTAAKTEK